MGHRFRQLRWKDLHRHPRRVLALIIENLVPRDDLPHGQCFPVQNPYGQFSSRDEGLDHDLVVIAGGQGYCRLKLARGIDFGKADRATLFGGLDD
jgi:hypothetical protein